MPRPTDPSVTNLGTLNATDAIPIDRVGVDLAKNTTPADILNYTKDKTAVAGLLKGNGTAISAAVSGTDYAAALGADDNYVTGAEKIKLANLSGANTGDQDLSGYSTTSHRHFEQTVTPDVVEFQLTPLVPTTIGSTYWDTTYHTLATVTSADTTLQHGQEVVVWCKNRSGVAIVNGDVVYAVSGSGATPTIAKADADIEAASYTLGVATQNIADNADGFITVIGNVNGIQTNGGNYGESWTEGDILYLSSTAGGLTKTKPTPPKHGVYVATVTYSHANNGTLFVHPAIGYEIDELHDVLITNKADGEALVYEASSGLWKNKVVASAYTLPVASPSVLGGVKQGTGTSIDANGVITVNAEYYKEHSYDISLKTNPTDPGTTIDNPYIAGSNGETRLLLQNSGVAAPVWVQLPSTGFTQDQRYEIDTSTTGEVYVITNGSWRETGSDIVGQLIDTTDVYGQRWSNRAHLVYEFYTPNRWTAVDGEALITRNIAGASGWGNAPEVSGTTVGAIQRYTLTANEYANVHVPVTTTSSSSISIGLTGQALTADAIFGTTLGTITEGNDTRLFDARTPTVHAASHINTGSDPVPMNSWHGVVSRTAVAPLPTSIVTTTFTLATGTTPLQYYFKGTLVTVSTDQSVVITATAGKYYIYFADAVGTLSMSASFPDLKANVLVAIVVWNGTDLGLVYDERHNYTRNIDWHLATHEGIGTRYVSGLAFTYAGTTNVNTTFSVSSGQINDEDIYFAITTQPVGRIWNQTSATTYAFLTTTSTRPYYYTTGIVAVNGSTYALVTPVTSSARYFNYFIYASTDILNPIYIVTETVTVGNIGGYTTAANARAASPPSFGGTNMSPELKLLYRVVVNGAGLVQTPVSGDDYRTGGSIPGGGTASTSHASLSNLELAGTGVLYGHIDDQTQTIAGAKTFTNGVVADVTGTASGNPSTASLAALSTGIVKVTTSTGALTTAVNSDLPAMTATVGGAVPTPPNNTTTFLRGDGTFAAPATSSGFKVGIPPAAFSIVGSTAEPLYAFIDDTNFDYPVLQYTDGATELNAFFIIPSKMTSGYAGGSIKVDIDFTLIGGTLTNTHTIKFGVGLVEVNESTTLNVAPPIESGATDGTVTGYAKTTYTLGASEVAYYRHTITATITADASISAGQVWAGRLHRRTGLDTSVAAAYVTGITVYE